MDILVSFKNRYLSVINGQWKGIIPNSIKLLLVFISYLYRGILALRELFYQKDFIKKTTLPVPIISIGNITLGGTGKTPLVEHIAVYIKKKGKKVAILSRGYGAKKKKQNKSLEVYNDEYLMLRENLTDIPNVINSNRVLSGRKAIKEYHADCLLLDDGFQHHRLNRTLDIVIINALNPFGYDCVFPGGFLRESLRNLKRADLFIIAHSNLCSNNELTNLKDRLNRYNNGIPIVETTHQPVNIENINDGTILPVEWLKEKRIYAFCAIGNPESFSKCLANQGAKITKFKPFLDHYFYTKDELEEIIKDAEHAGVEAIVITQKDKVKILEVLAKKDLDTYSIPFYVFKIKINVTNGTKILERFIDNALEQK
ncbi:MAG: tetraacyldisaccharide 4'-kinase [Candidatus Anammoxibacter sp.]